MPNSRQRAHFHLLGFPVHVGGGFVIFMILLALINRGGEFGIWLAGGVAVFTLIHELAHAVVARRAGAEASISLEFMAGFTSYSSKEPLSRPWTIAISLAGPLTHVAAGAAAIYALGGSPFERPSPLDSERLAALWWAGPIIGAINLIPVLPLDGGHATTTLLDRLIPGRAERVMIYASIAVTVGALAASPFVERLEGLTIFIGFLLLIQLQSFYAHREHTAKSPFDMAAAAYRKGDQVRARAILAKATSRRRPLMHAGRAAIENPPAELGSVVGSLRPPFPRGHPYNEYVLSSLLVRYGRPREAAEYSAEGYNLEPDALSACGVARAAAALGDAPTTAAWLRTASGHGLPDEQLAGLVLSPGFARVRDHPSIQALLGPGTAPTSVPRLT